MAWHELIGDESPQEARDRRLMTMPILSGAEIDTLWACRQACWDGNLPSKSGRDSLLKRGMICKWNGWQIATAEGVAWLVEMGKLKA